MYSSTGERVCQAVPFVANVTISLIKTGSYSHITTVMVGTRVQLQIQIAFPVGTTDLLVELFVPSSGSQLMMLCNPQVTFVGPNIQYTNNATIEFDTIPNTVYVSLCFYPQPAASSLFLFLSALAALNILWTQFVCG